MLGGVRELCASELAIGSQLDQVLTIKVGETQSVCGVNDQVEHRPAQAEAAGFAREPADHFCPTSNFFE